MSPINELRIQNLRVCWWGHKAIADFCELTRDEVRSFCSARHLEVRVNLSHMSVSGATHRLTTAQHLRSFTLPAIAIAPGCNAG